MTQPCLASRATSSSSKPKRFPKIRNSGQQVILTGRFFEPDWNDFQEIKSYPKTKKDARRRLFQSGAGDGIRTHDPNLGKVVL
ncbi:MAG: hypothetical protein ABF576_09650, partial [Gluconobacter japonicus]